MSLITKNDFVKQNINNKNFTILELEIALETVHILLEDIFVEEVVTVTVLDLINFSTKEWLIGKKSLLSCRLSV